jgi:hypothetical protein
MYSYIKNGKPFESAVPLYFFEWKYEGGSVYFGLHGSEDEYEESWKRDPNKHDRRLMRKVPIELAK